MSRTNVPEFVLSPYNGSVVDLESPVGPFKLLKGVPAGLDNSQTERALPEVVLYEHNDFGGANWRTNLNYTYVGDFWNDKISSIVVVAGVWEFYQHDNYNGPRWRLGPGYYRWVEDVNIPNDIISSFRVVG
ncbi:beta/gamma crystallin family protein [Chitinophaga nivalis]|uniref:Beta/gamma crystallin family protein n=1 Tax=Chitinophaga nivalis TaxID=2991709 RepID=A0ABT3ITC9_9BACT|nr:beta/gamma crystallin family protein [Chitinophaga nivalis]MCW3463164.1 beta/gamma crystallin family protein [Chitinophaga nivalis]MCW3487146.1 beta/gamma crystallin family protein [Chitinophaga nivalis]